MLWVLKHPSSKFLLQYMQAKKLLEVAVQMQLHLIPLHGQRKDGKSEGNG